jgi:hypothetical protein
MSKEIDGLIERIQRLEEELEKALAEQSEFIKSEISELPDELFRQQAALKQGAWQYLREANLLSILTAPLIYSLIVPFLLLDLMASIYQKICFPIYGLKKVDRSKYFVFDRRHLSYLNFIEKINCTYCSYANGLVAYVRDIASLTEAHWCPIKHAKGLYNPHTRYGKFAKYGDAERYRAIIDQKQKKIL